MASLLLNGVILKTIFAFQGTSTEGNSLAKMVSFNDDVLIRGRIYL